MELVIAIGVSAVFIGAVTTLIIQNTRMAGRTRDIAVANSFVENKVESLRSIGYLGLALGTASLTSELPAELNTPRSATQIISTASTSVKKVDISITYNDRGKPKTYSYTTFVGELGVGQY